MAKIKRIHYRTYLVLEGAKLVAELRFFDDGSMGEWQFIDYCGPGKCYGNPMIEKIYEDETLAVMDLRLCYPQHTIHQVLYLLGTLP